MPKSSRLPLSSIALLGLVSLVLVTASSFGKLSSVATLWKSYEGDVNDPRQQSVLASQNAALKAGAGH
jgi:hypothetical protein